MPKPNTMDDLVNSLVEGLGDICHEDYMGCHRDHSHEDYQYSYSDEVINLLSKPEAKALIRAKLQEVDRAAKEKRIKDNQSFCGCPMCEHHSAPYRASLKGGDDDN